MSLNKTILIADDKLDVIRALEALLKSRGYQTIGAQTPQEIERIVQHKSLDLVLLDLNYSRDTTSGAEGIALLESIQTLQPSLPVVVMTAYANMDLAIEVMRNGAKDFIEKPWDNERLISIVSTQLALSKALEKVELLQSENHRLSTEGPDFIATSSSMTHVITMMDRIANTDTNVLITGEHGTGKGVIANLLHKKSSRQHEPFVSVNIGAIPDNLFESELFGHVKGAFTDARNDRKGRFELANDGTLFLDEIGNLSLSMQAKLLRVLETGEYEPVGSSDTLKTNARVVAATNANLKELTEKGEFREDLLFRLNTIEIHMPPLRERGEDIRLLADYYLKKYCEKYQLPQLGYDTGAYKGMEVYSWPGNVRELDHSVQRAVLMTTGETIGVEQLRLTQNQSTQQHPYEDMTLEAVEKLLIEKAIERCQGNMVEVAKHLGIARSSLYRRMEKFELARAQQ